MKKLLIYASCTLLFVACIKKQSTPTPVVVAPPVVPTVKTYIPEGWKPLQAFNEPRVCATAIAVGDKIYVGLGYNGATSDFRNTVAKDWYEYDPAANKWTAKANFPGVARSNAVGFAINNKIYVGLGSFYSTTQNDTFNDFYEYDPAADKWTNKANFIGAGRDQPVWFSIGNKGYVGTGNTDPRDPGTVTNDFYEYDPATDKWTAKSAIKGARCRAFGFAVGGKGYIGGGEDANTTKLMDFFEYDPASNAWVTKANFPEGNARARGFDFGALGMVAGGRVGVGNAISGNLYQYNPADNTWTKKSDLAAENDTQKGRSYPVALAIKTKIFVGLGNTSSANTATLKDFYEYVPK
jgi:N-acetylneuraminic acid mutarotase